MVDDGAPYSGLGSIGLRALSKCIMPEWNGALDPLPDLVQHPPFWQFLKSRDASKSKRFLGSVDLTVT